MRFTKFFRRYSRTLLMVFMSLLLVVFLLGDVLQSQMRGRSADKLKIGHSIYGDFYNTDLGAAEADQKILVQMGLRDAGMFEPLEMRLLMQEAQRLGVRVGREQAKATLAQMGRPVDQLEQSLDFIQKSSRRTTGEVYDLLGRWLAVREVMRFQEQALDQSVPRTEVAYRDAKQQANVQLSVIDSRAFVHLMAEPTEEELQAFFEANKDRFSAHTDDKLEFGYRQPNRVRLEYVTIDPKSLESKIHARERELERFFEENARTYTKSVAAENPSASRPTQTVVQMTFEEAKEKVRQDYRRTRAVQEAQSLMNQIHDSVYRPWQAERPDKQGFRPEPKDSVVSFAGLRDQFADRADVIYKQTPLMSQAELQKFFDDRPDLLKQMDVQGTSPEPLYAEGANTIPISEFAFRVKGLFTPASGERLPVLNLLEPSPVLNTRQPAPGAAVRPGSRQIPQVPYQPYMFRVVQVEESGPPGALEEVREQVRSDYKLMKAHEAAGEYARKLAETARAEGLAAAAGQATELRQILLSAEPPPSPTDPTSSASQAPYTKEFGPAAPLQPVTRGSERVGQYLTDSSKLPREIFAATERPTTDTAPAKAVVVDDVAKLFKWAVIEVEGLKPIYRGEFEQQRARLQRGGSTALDREVLGGWVNPENIRLRNGFTYTAAAATQPASEP
jgi:hypothetical protein